MSVSSLREKRETEKVTTHIHTYTPVPNVVLQGFTKMVSATLAKVLFNGSYVESVVSGSRIVAILISNVGQFKTVMYA